MGRGIPALAAMVAQFKYKPGWRFWLETGATGTLGGCPPPDVVDDVLGPAVIAVTFGEPVRLVVCLTTDDSLQPGKKISVPHRFDVPQESAMPWHWWLLSCVQAVETHEMCEAFQVGTERPFYPEHGPEARLYAITDRGLGGFW